MDNNFDNSKDSPTMKKKYNAKLSDKGITIDFDREDIEQNLPHLTKELLGEPIDGQNFSLNKYQRKLNDNDEDDENDDEKEDDDSSDGSNIQDGLNGIKLENPTKDQIRQRTNSQYDKSEELYLPKTEDFIRRCSTINEAEEIIKFQLKRGEITQEKADELILICHEKGLQYFGTKKVWGYYEQKYRRNQK